MTPAIRAHRLRELLRDMVDIYSPSGKEEELLAFLHTFLNRHGLPVRRQPVDGHRYNLLVAPPDVDVRLALIGHVDTVIAYDLERWSSRREGDVLHGLGSADMKGGCAALIEAYITAWNSGHARVPAALVLVVGEEEEGDGVKRLIRDQHFPWALIAEPTDLSPCLGHYGYLELQVITQGKRVHASLAHMGHNPIEAMLRLLLRMTRYLETQRPEVVYNIRDLESARSGFAVPDRCNAWVDLHIPPTAPVGEITIEIDDLLVRERQENPSFNGTLRFSTVHAGYHLSEKSSMAHALREVLEKRSLFWQPQLFRSHSDANLLWAAGVKPMLLGPGRLECAHSPEECVSIRQVETAAEIYLDLLLALDQSVMT